MPTFRIHMASGAKVDVDAATPKDAATRVSGPITKIKRVKESADA